MRRASWLLAVSLLFGVSYARAQPRAAGASSEPDAIQLDVLDCAQVSGASVRELVALEVAPRRVLAVGSTAPAATHAALSCPGAVAQVSVDDTRLATPLRLEIALGELEPSARSRLVALAIAELITTGRMQGSSAATAAAGSPASTRAGVASDARGSVPNRVSSAASSDALGSAAKDVGGASQRATAHAFRAAEGVGRDSPSAVALGDAQVPAASGGYDASINAGSVASSIDVESSGDAAAVRGGDPHAFVSDEGAGVYDDAADSGSAAPGAQIWLGLGAARVAVPSMFAPSAAVGVGVYWRALALNADLRFEHAQTTRSAAELQLDAGSLAVVPAWRLHTRSADISIGPGVRVGYASLHATPRDAAFLGQTLGGFWLAPCAQLALQLRFAARWAVRVGAELAYVTRTLRGLDSNGNAVLALRDLALAAQLGISWDAVAAH